MMPFKMSPADKDRVIKALSVPHACVNLICDDQKITLVVTHYKALKYRIFTYVNDVFLGRWCLPENCCIESKFLRKETKRLLSNKQLELIKQLSGIKEYQNAASAQLITYQPDWSSPAAAINHLCKVCDSISLES